MSGLVERLTRQAVGYFLVGGTAAVVDIGLFHLLKPHFGTLVAPAAVSFIIAVTLNYLLSSLWVYRRRWRSLSRATRFMLFASVGLCINVGSTWALAAALAIPPTLAKTGGTAIAFVFNFLMNSFLVFSAEDDR